MELFKNMMFILLTSSIVENVVLAKFLGCCPFLGVSKKLDSAVGMSSAVIFVMLIGRIYDEKVYEAFVPRVGRIPAFDYHKLRCTGRYPAEPGKPL